VVILQDGRLLNGIARGQDGRTLAVQTMTEKVTLERAEIRSSQESQLSLMPDGLLESLSFPEVRDLIAYLMHPTQVPLPASGK
jgi:putative heme-binding domain-containing protein